MFCEINGRLWYNSTGHWLDLLKYCWYGLFILDTDHYIIFAIDYIKTRIYPDAWIVHINGSVTSLFDFILGIDSLNISEIKYISNALDNYDIHIIQKKLLFNEFCIDNNICIDVMIYILTIFIIV